MYFVVAFVLVSVVMYSFFCERYEVCLLDLLHLLPKQTLRASVDIDTERCIVVINELVISERWRNGFI